MFRRSAQVLCLIGLLVGAVAAAASAEIKMDVVVQDDREALVRRQRCQRSHDVVQGLRERVARMRRLIDRL